VRGAIEGTRGPGDETAASLVDGGSMNQEHLESEVARLRAENEALKARAQRGGQLRVSDKGGLSVYGLGRFPVTLYKEQWRRLLDMADEIRAFIREHESELKSKD
jgi:hypothetical protein